MKPRSRRFILCAGLSLTFILTVVWSTSWWWTAAFYCDSSFGIACYRGVVTYYFSSFAGTEWHLRYAADSEYGAIWWPRLTYLFVLIPLWIPWLAFLGETMFVWFRFKPPAPGHCQCGYNLAGNESGVCPECGTPFTE